MPFEKFVLSKSLKEEYADETRIVQARVNALCREREPGSEEAVGNRVQYVIKQGPLGSKVTDLADNPRHVRERGIPLNYLYYWKNMMKNALGNIFNVVGGIDFEAKCTAYEQRIEAVRLGTSDVMRGLIDRPPRRGRGGRRMEAGAGVRAVRVRAARRARVEETEASVRGGGLGRSGGGAAAAAAAPATAAATARRRQQRRQQRRRQRRQRHSRAVPAHAGCQCGVRSGHGVAHGIVGGLAHRALNGARGAVALPRACAHEQPARPRLQSRDCAHLRTTPRCALNARRRVSEARCGNGRDSGR